VLGVTARRALALLAGALLLAGCGSGSGSSSSSESAATETPASTAEAPATTTASEGGLSIKAIDPSKFLRGSSVGFGEGPPPSFAPVVRTRATKRAGCRLRADASAIGIHLLISDIVPLHVANPDYSKVRRPPTNGHHRPLWADWGTRVVRMWAGSPPYLLIVPGLPADVPQRGATVTSWLRAMICKTWNARTLGAIRTYRDAYRGTGPEQVPSLNTGTTAQDLPTPALPDPSSG
jgi:hypothetical protein